MTHWLATNWLALVALIVAVVAIVPAFLAVRQGRRSHQLATEVHDVTWALAWVRPGLAKLIKQSTRCTAERDQGGDPGQDR